MFSKQDDTPYTDKHPFDPEFGCNICDFVLMGFYCLNLDNNKNLGICKLQV